MIGYASTLTDHENKKGWKEYSATTWITRKGWGEGASAEETERPWPSPSLPTALRPFTSPGYHNNANHADGGTGEPAVRSSEWGKLALHPCLPYSGEGKMPSPSPLVILGKWEGYPCPLPDAGLGRVDSVPCLGNTGELTPLTDAWVSWLQEHECERLSPAPHLPCMVVWARERSPPPCPLRPVVAGEPSLMSLEWESWWCRCWLDDSKDKRVGESVCPLLLTT